MSGIVSDIEARAIAWCNAERERLRLKEARKNALADAAQECLTHVGYRCWHYSGEQWCEHCKAIDKIHRGYRAAAARAGRARAVLMRAVEAPRD